MTVVKTDAFSLAGTRSLDAYDSGWVIVAGAITQSDDHIYPGQAAECGAGWNTDAFNDDQYAQLTLPIAIDTGWIGPAVRVDTGTPSASYYGAYVRDLYFYFFKNVGGTWTQFSATGINLAAGDVLYVEANGTSISFQINSVDQSGSPHTDSALSSGHAGVTGYNDNSSCEGDDFEGGNLAGAPTTYTLTAAAGSMAISGAAANLLYDRLLSAATTSISIAGTDAGLLSGYHMAAEATSLVVAAGAANLFHDRVLSSQGGAFSAAGQDAGLLAAHLLTASGSTITIAGVNASLLFGRVLTASGAAITIAGTDVSLIYQSGYSLTAYSGAFAVDGSDVSLTASFLLVAASMTISYQGADASFRYVEVTPPSGVGPGGAAGGSPGGGSGGMPGGMSGGVFHGGGSGGMAGGSAGGRLFLGGLRRS